MPAVRHLAIIPDGNRRWARARGQEPSEGHRAGMAKMGAMATAAFEAGVQVFTFWWGSPANLTRRDPAEVAVIVEVLRGWLSDEAPALLRAHNARFRIHGSWQELCPQLASGVEAARAAAGDGERVLCVLMSYDGRDEILAAAEELHGSGGSRQAFQERLWTGNLPPVDVLIRTGDSAHLSAGFMIWSLSEAQLVWEEAMWPAFTVDRLNEILAQRDAAERRYGS
jgi:undecaprenyl diphosphate synthase